MGQPYVGEIRMFGGNFAPVGWAFCQGQALSIYENDVLFQLIGTTYGGDGQSTFNLPNLASRVPIHFGSLAGTPYPISMQAGAESVTLTNQQIPVHNHALLISSDPANSPNPGGNVGATPLTATPYYEGTPGTALNGQSVGVTGGSQPHENMQPFLVINFIISLYGIFPSQT